MCAYAVFSSLFGRLLNLLFFFFQAEDGIRDHCVTGVQTCALPISPGLRGRQPHTVGRRGGRRPRRRRGRGAAPRAGGDARPRLPVGAAPDRVPQRRRPHRPRPLLPAGQPRLPGARRRAPAAAGDQPRRTDRRGREPAQHELPVLHQPRVRGRRRRLRRLHRLRACLPAAARGPVGDRGRRRLRRRRPPPGRARRGRPRPAGRPRRQRRRLDDPVRPHLPRRLRGRRQLLRGRRRRGAGARHPQVRVPLPGPPDRAVAGGGRAVPAAVADPPPRPALLPGHPPAGPGGRRRPARAGGGDGRGAGRQAHPVLLRRLARRAARLPPRRAHPPRHRGRAVLLQPRVRLRPARPGRPRPDRPPRPARRQPGALIADRLGSLYSITCRPTMVGDLSRSRTEGRTASVRQQTQVQVKVLVPGNHSMVSLLGTRDELLKLIEAAFESSVFVRGNEITITGEQADSDRVARLFEELIVLLERGDALTADTVGRSIDMVRGDQAARPSVVFGDSVLSSRGRSVKPKTVGQKKYVDAIRNNTVVFGIGPAGTGKTYLAMAVAVQALTAKLTNRLILTRPAVEAGEKLGFLPGTLSEKIDPYLRPLYDALYEMMDADQIARLMERGTIEVAPLGYMRGRTLNDSFIVLDEAQNTTPEQMKMFLTRLGFNSKAVVTGDITQIDLPSGQHSGLNVVREILTGIDDLAFVYMSSRDVVRHRIVQDIVEAYRRYDEARS